MRRITVTTLLLLATTLLILVSSATGSGAIVRISTDSTGGQSNAASIGATSMTPDGRYVVFDSLAMNLVPGDTNLINGVFSVQDIFIKDTLTGQTTRVSTDSAGGQTNNHSGVPTVQENSGQYPHDDLGFTHPASISPDGRFVVFQSLASNLVPGDNNAVRDIFIKDTATSLTRRVSTGPAEVQANGESFNATLSADGRLVAFESYASNLVPGDTNGLKDAFVKDLTTGAVVRVSTATDGTQASGGESLCPAISADGRYATFASYASNLVAGDGNGASDIFIKDISGGQIWLISSSSSGAPGAGNSFVPAISADGRYVAFLSLAANLVSGDTNGLRDVFLKDRTTGTTTRVSTTATGGQVYRQNAAPAISPNGRYVAFPSLANTLVTGDTNNYQDIFVKDTLTGQVDRASGNGGWSANYWPAGNFYLPPAVTATGHFAVFTSLASNLVPNDDNGNWDIFMGETSFGCGQPGERPSLYLSHSSFFASYADYTNRYLSVDFTVSNHGPGMAQAAEIDGVTNTRGASLITSLPVDLGDIAEGSESVVTVRYLVPAGIAYFDTMLTGSALDECGTIFTYPPE